jgi:UDP-N-acetylmuramate dehydrogenase
MSATSASPSLLTSAQQRELRGRFGERVRFDEPLGPYTWWKVGGPADAFVDRLDIDDVAWLLPWARKQQLPWFVLGAGSNLLVGDGGLRGIVFRLGGAYEALDVRREADAVVVDAGGAADLSRLVTQAASLGALGVDGLAGVPATVGGAVRMNAGTDHEIGEFVREVRVQTASRPQPQTHWVGFEYRRTSLAPDMLVAGVSLAFACGDPGEVRARTQERLVRRKETQPVGQPNAGSCFRNPPGDRAGRLIEAAGAKGWREGGAEVSLRHANFIVNVGGATARDISVLLARVHRAVLDAFGVDLHLEVHLVGEFIADV